MTNAPHSPLANWNGQEMPLSEVRVSVLDRGFLFGDAIYEVVRVYNGKPFLFTDHVERLGRNFQKLQLNSDARLIAQRALETLAHSGIKEGTIYVQVTRGEAPRTHRFPEPAVRPNELIYVQSFHDHYGRQRSEGGKVILIDDIRWKRCDIKSVNLLANCLGAEQAHAAGCDEAVFVEADGTLIEGTHTSLFAVRDGAILTAPLGNHILPGITRKLVLRLAAETGIPVIEEPLPKEKLETVDELFLTGTTVEVLPIVLAGDIRIGDGTVGPVVKRLRQAYQAAVEAECGR
ncbi:aminotransferase class IV [Planctomicrobium piriforme]|uniref:D-alanine transaminase n=1 Tax=Planctomicrobium piriforme TaxID=1576369 RepID=A0A1I3THA8_9PLAN|nr:aminotransferase class IV [Planctomicrobium piriforme]SFJ69819.1 D-alanine transaminase [Planctomicrobium piriforme]